ncbi:MAG: hypothetical protein AAFW68_14555, partial [Pseudomonadota bacterium]
MAKRITKTRPSGLLSQKGVLPAALLSVGAVSLMTSPALAQRQIDDPNLSPMLFGPTKKEERDKILQDQEDS